MSERSDRAIWAGVERRLSGVEAFIPDAPPWRPSTQAELRGEVRLGPTVRPSAGSRPRRSPLVLVFAVIVLLLALVAGALLVGSLLPDGEPFGPFGALRQGDGEARAALLADGRTLIVSGEWQGMGDPRARADMWDPAAGFVPIDPPTLPRVNPTATLLLDGRVIVIGGYGRPFQYESSATASAEVWDPGTSRFLPTGSMAHARVSHTATLLPDGRVLVVGGAGPEGAAAEAELWDPRTGTFGPAGRLAKPRVRHAATLLLDGRVMVAGGWEPYTEAGVAEVEVWDPSTHAFTAVTSLRDAPRAMSLTRLPDGSVLMTGAFVLPDRSDDFRGVLIWEPSGAVGPSPEMGRSRDGHTATLLADGRVMVAGGRSRAGGMQDSVELWDPADGMFQEATPLARRVAHHTAVLQADGRVLIVPDATGPDGVVEPFLYDPEPDP